MTTLLWALLVQDKPEDKPASFTKDIMPIFKATCLECHNPKKFKGKLDMTSYETLIKGGKKGPEIEPGKPEKSRLVEMISGDKPDMPDEGDPLKPAQVALIVRWIKEGAKDDTPKK